MKSPAQFLPDMFAPCGVNCMVCYVHANPRKYGRSCTGCLSDTDNKPPRCSKCRIRECVAAKNMAHCFECRQMPCTLIKNLDKSYRKRYRISLVENNLKVREHGISNFMLREREQWTCKQCGGLVSLQDGACGECQAPHP